MTHAIPSRLRTTTLVLACSAVLGLGACAGMSERTRQTTIGAGVGAVAGSVITGSTTGAAVGAVIGGVIGNENAKDKKK